MSFFLKRHDAYLKLCQCAKMTGGGMGVVTCLTKVPMRTKTFIGRYGFTSKSPVFSQG